MTGLTVAQLAARIYCSEERTLAILRSLERDGLAVETRGVWRLTEQAERRHGRHLREVDQ